MDACMCSVGITCAVRAGKVIGESKSHAASAPTSCKVSSYDSPTESNKIASCRIRYATRDKLEVLGLISASSASSGGSLPPAPDKYSAAYFEQALNFYFGLHSTSCPIESCDGDAFCCTRPKSCFLM